MFGTKGLVAYFVHIFMKFPILFPIFIISIGTYISKPQLAYTLNHKCVSQIQHVNLLIDRMQDSCQPYKDRLIESAKSSRDQAVEFCTCGYASMESWAKNHNMIQYALQRLGAENMQAAKLTEANNQPKTGFAKPPRKFFPINEHKAKEKMTRQKKKIETDRLFNIANDRAVAESSQLRTFAENQNLAKKTDDKGGRVSEDSEHIKKESPGIIRADRQDKRESGNGIVPVIMIETGLPIEVSYSKPPETVKSNRLRSTELSQDEKEKKEMAIRLLKIVVMKQEKEKENRETAMQFQQFLHNKNFN